MPSHADEEASVVAPICGPPVLRLGHQRMQIFLERLVVELAKGGRVVKLVVHRVRGGRVLVQDAQIELLGPPIAVASAACARGRACGR